VDQFRKMKVIDGGLSTELERLGAVIEGNLWTGQNLLTNPQLVEAAHRNYAEAGAKIAITASYQVSRIGFEEIGLTKADADEALRRSVSIARTGTAGTDSKVAASVGPYGAVLHDGSEFRGDYKVSQWQLEDFHSERLEVLLDAEPDMLAVETIPNVIESKALRNVLEGVKIPFWISFTAGSGDKLWSGEEVVEAAQAVAGLNNLISVGVNCVDPIHVASLITKIYSATSLPSVVYPNCGGTWDSASGAWEGGSKRSLSQWIPEWKNLPIEWVGGCCGTDALDIEELSLTLESITD
jgi:S-methylmethionine-dependent homocysteine/selenocysteine methylase